jgi:hypothetical protein
MDLGPSLSAGRLHDPGHDRPGDYLVIAKSPPGLDTGPRVEASSPEASGVARQRRRDDLAPRRGRVGPRPGSMRRRLSWPTGSIAAAASPTVCPAAPGAASSWVRARRLGRAASGHGLAPGYLGPAAVVITNLHHPRADDDATEEYISSGTMTRPPTSPAGRSRAASRSRSPRAPRFPLAGSWWWPRTRRT